MKTLIFDLETGGVNAFYADLGFILVFGYKWLGEDKVHVIRVSDFDGWFRPQLGGINDKPLVKKSLKIMDQANLIVAHYGAKFDRRFFQGRCVIHKLNPPPYSKMRDTWHVSRSNFAFSSNRLGHLSTVLDLDEKKADKGKGWPLWWKQAMAGYKPGIDRMAEYCAQDVLTTEHLYLRERPFDHSYSRVIVDRAICPSCGGEIKYRGFNYTKTHKYRKFQCKQCGSWAHESKPFKE